MPIASNKFIVFSDNTDLLLEGFSENPGHGYNLTSNEMVTKAEAEAIWDLNTTHSNWTPLASNQWVARYRMIPDATIPTGYNLMGNVWVTSSNTNSISIQWADPQAVKAGQTVSYYKVEYKLVSSGTWTVIGTNYPSATRTATIGSLSSNSNYDIRVRFRTSGAEWSNYEETNGQTGIATSLYVFTDDITTNGRVTVRLINSFPSDTVTVRLSLTSSGTSGCEDDWYWSDAGNTKVLEGYNGDDAPISHDFVINTGFGGTVTVGWGQAFRAGSCYFEGWAFGNVQIISSSQGNPYVSGTSAANIIGGNSPWA